MTAAVLSGAAAAGVLAMPGTANAAPAVFRVQLQYIHVPQTQDNNADEVFVKINGQKVWGPHSITQHTTADLNAVAPRYFDAAGQMTISYWDQDPGRDDHVGTVTLTCANPMLGDNGIAISGNDGVYWVYFRVEQLA
ncbi:hypothetical protein [Yinghuangia soli]|uniref:Uncharacterized protein n=1 Tax=Yinghuangia soli TaxID=2908204 RepID=A0AA41Q4T3_9ACTN|nr:hypothetical protein [Yinghuangia soli]MCF2530975.1 hypothetical protein [Yinghuangia soli]